MTIEEFIKKGYITNIAAVQGLMDGSMPIEKAKHYVTNIAACKLLEDIIRSRQAETAETPVTEAISGIKFIVDGTEYVYTGKPTTTINKGLKSLNISTPVYHNNEVITGQMSTLEGLTLTTTKVEDVVSSEVNENVETIEVTE